MAVDKIAEFKMNLIKFYEEVVPATHLQFQQKIAAKLHELIVTNNQMMTKHPVKTGWAVNNWDVRAYGTFQRPPLAPIGKQPPEDGGQVLDKRDVSGEIAKAKPFGIIWVYNNVPYITALENGHSTQAPNGMVEGALNDLQVFLNDKGFL